MAYTDKISFNKSTEASDELVEWGLFGHRWTLTNQWTNIGGGPLQYKEGNKYFTFIQNSQSPYCVIQRTGLYYLHLHNCIFREGSSIDAAQVGHCGIAINDENVANQSVLRFYNAHYFYWTNTDAHSIILQCGGFLKLKRGDTVAAYVSKSEMGYNLYIDGQEYMQIVHIKDLEEG